VSVRYRDRTALLREDSVGETARGNAQARGRSQPVTVEVPWIIDRAQAGRYALGLVDLHLPDADGVSLIRALKAGEDTRAMPVIVVSGDVARGKVRGRSLEVADWMEKPVDPSRLRLAVQALARADASSCWTR
jgi:DNA-binding response OmpR family regulator